VSTNRRLVLALFVAIPLGGCAQTIRVTYYSDPPGASVYANDNQQPFGYTPVTLTYKPSESGNCKTYQPVLVRWVSGASASVEPRICLAQGPNQFLTFVRPSQVPGQSFDAQFALEIQRQAAQKAAQDKADRDAAYATAAAAFLASRPAPQPATQPVRCTSIISGQLIFTNCT